MGDEIGLRDGRKRYYAEIGYDVLDRYMAQMRGSDWKVYCALCRFANWTTGESFPSIKLLGERCGIGPSTVRQALKRLVELGLLKREPRHQPDGARSTDLYTLLDAPAETDTSPLAKSNTPLGVLNRGDSNERQVNQQDARVRALAEPKTAAAESEPILSPVVNPRETEAEETLSEESDTLAREEQRAPPMNQRRVRCGQLAWAFITATGIVRPVDDSKRARAAAQVRWWSPLTTILRLVDWDVGEGARLVREAVEHMRADKLTISAPQSIEQVCISLHAEQGQRVTAGTGARWREG